MYRDWQGRLSPTMRQERQAGEKMFVDYAGQTMPIVTSTTGEVRDAQIFIAVLGASNFSFVRAQWSQSLPDWIGAHVDAFNAFGGVTAQVVCDNLKAGATKASRFEPTINATYREMAEHYGAAIMPTRPRKPHDKAKVEVGVQVVERWVLARLRNRTFFSIDELNQELRRLTADLNARIMRHLGASRRELFERLDRPELQPLPETPYEYAEWRRARVGTHASLPVGTIMRSRRHPEQGCQSCVGILRLAKTDTPERLEDACERAPEIGAHAYSSVHSLLKNGLDRVARRPDHPDHVKPDHGNVRGPGYYH